MNTAAIVRYTDNTEAPVSTRSASAAVATVERSASAGAHRQRTHKVWFTIIARTPAMACTFYPEGARECLLDMPKVATTQATSFVDHPERADGGTASRMVADADHSAPGGDLMLISPAVAVSVG